MIKNFTIYGERCSGTNFLETIITGSSYFHKNNNAAFDIPVTWDFGHKHFFGFNDQDIINHGAETLFIGIVRDPYNWLNSLFVERHHVPQCNWSIDNFLFNEWYSIEHDRFSSLFNKEYLEDRHFETQQRYKNIFELRANKLRYLYDIMPKIAKNYMLVTYEELCDNQINIVDAISDRFGLNIQNSNYIRAKLHQPNNILDQYRDVITKNINWDIEKLYGYKIRPNNITEFFEQNAIDPAFDPTFYAKAYPQTKDFCQECNMDEKHRLFYHYKTNGIFENYEKNLPNLLRDITQIRCDHISTGEIDDIVPVHPMFQDSYVEKTQIGKSIAKKSNIAVVGLARNCELQLQDSIDRVFKLETNSTSFFIYENDSTDKTKDILKTNSDNNNIEISLNNFSYPLLSDRSLERTHRLAKFRNHCLDWIRDNHYDSDYVVVLDLDADLGFSVDGIYNNIFWLNSTDKAGGIGSYSLFLNHYQGIYKFAHYDSFAFRFNDWQPSRGNDYHHIWFKDFHPMIGSNPIPCYTCFGGLAVYKTEALIRCKYDGYLGSEHVRLHQNLQENGWNMYLNPSSRFFSVCRI